MPRRRAAYDRVARNSDDESLESLANRAKQEQEREKKREERRQKVKAQRKANLHKLKTEKIRARRSKPRNECGVYSGTSSPEFASDVHSSDVEDDGRYIAARRAILDLEETPQQRPQQLQQQRPRQVQQAAAADAAAAATGAAGSRSSGSSSSQTQQARRPRGRLARALTCQGAEAARATWAADDDADVEYSDAVGASALRVAMRHEKRDRQGRPIPWS